MLRGKNSPFSVDRIPQMEISLFVFFAVHLMKSGFNYPGIKWHNISFR
jgi:hypothetical protein